MIVFERGRGGTLIFLFFLFFLNVEANFNKTVSRQRQCDATGCEFPGFTGPIIVINYQPGVTQSYIASVPVGLPWQVIFVDGTCFNDSFNVIVEDTASVASQSLTVTSTSGAAANEPTQSSAQANSACGNTIRSFSALGPPGTQTPYVPSQLTYATTFRVRITATGTVSGYAFMQIIPYYGTSFAGLGGPPPSQLFITLPWQAYVPSDGLTISTVCAARGGIPFISNGSFNVDLNTLLVELYFNPSYSIKRMLFDDGTGVTCWSWEMPSLDATFISDPLECAQVTAGSLPVACYYLFPPLYNTFPT